MLIIPAIFIGFIHQRTQTIVPTSARLSVLSDNVFILNAWFSRFSFDFLLFSAKAKRNWKYLTTNKNVDFAVYNYINMPKRKIKFSLKIVVK